MSPKPPLLSGIIAAVATPPGIGGIAVIRVSGTGAVELADRVFRGGSALKDAAGYTAHYGEVVDAGGGRIDEVVATVFRAPHSYTGEETVEISCHGGTAVSRAVLARIIDAGGREAQPGEFTRRAFLNGRMDLAQAEAVADLIHARTEAAQTASRGQLEGRLSAYVRGIRERLTNAVAMLELSLDFAEEDVTFATRDQQQVLIDDAAEMIRRALETFAVGRVVRDGLAVALAGRPNTGKSSLLNAILGVRRAIVTELPGTTRDYIEESLVAHGALLRFTDTAGLRATEDPAEREGIGFGVARLREADVVALVEDLSEDAALGEAVESDIALAVRSGVEAERIVILLNKCDLHPLGPEERSAFAALIPRPLFVTSARTGEGLEEFLRWAADKTHLLNRASAEGDMLVTNARHADCFLRALHHLEAAKRSLSYGMTEEFQSLELRSAADALGEIIGEVTSEEILQQIFGRFCIGK